MAKDQLRDFHLFAMESALPFGMGILKNAKTGGLQKIMDVIKSKDPFSEFQVDGAKLSSLDLKGNRFNFKAKKIKQINNKKIRG